MTTIVVCLTVLAVAAIAAWLIHELVKDATSTRIVLADRDRAAQLAHADSATATSELAGAVRALQLVADRLTPAPSRVGQPVTIHTHDEAVIAGVVLEEYDDRTRIADAKFVTSAGAQPVPGGVATVLKRNESWRQEHGG